MTSRLALALAAGSLVIVNHESVSVGVTLVHLKPNPKNPRLPIHQKVVKELRPGIEYELTRNYSVPELRASEHLHQVLGRRRIEIVKTW